MGIKRTRIDFLEHLYQLKGICGGADELRWKGRGGIFTVIVTVNWLPSLEAAVAGWSADQGRFFLETAALGAMLTMNKL